MNIGRSDAETFMRDLRQCRFQSLPDALNSGPDFQPAVGREPRKDLLIKRAPFAVGCRAVRRLFREHRDAEAD